MAIIVGIAASAPGRGDHPTPYTSQGAERAERATVNATINIGHPDSHAALRTSAECLAKAAELQAQATQCGDADMRDRFQHLATHWRSLADQAVYQDAILGHLNDDRPSPN